MGGNWPFAMTWLNYKTPFYPTFLLFTDATWWCTVVAVKKLTTFDRSQIKHFIIRVVVLSQVHHGSTVKLKGCRGHRSSFAGAWVHIPSGTLSQQSNEKYKASLLSWEDHYQIAYKVAGAAAHTQCHRDVKQSNTIGWQIRCESLWGFHTSRPDLSWQNSPNNILCNVHLETSNLVDSHIKWWVQLPICVS